MAQTWGEGVNKQVLTPLATLVLEPSCSWGAGGGGRWCYPELRNHYSGITAKGWRLFMPHLGSLLGFNVLTFFQDLLGLPHRQMHSRVHSGSVSSRSHFTPAYTYLMAQDGLMHQPSIAIQANPRVTPAPHRATSLIPQSTLGKLGHQACGNLRSARSLAWPMVPAQRPAPAASESAQATAQLPVL